LATRCWLDIIHQNVSRRFQQGRVVIPAECCSAAGIKPGDEVLIELVGEGELRLSFMSRSRK
jgi:AbrB family looped-hinge helix DNA binding protein